MEKSGDGPNEGALKESVRPDPFERLRAHIEEEKKKAYADGFRRATTIIAQTVGMLDHASKLRIMNLLDRLEAELHATGG